MSDEQWRPVAGYAGLYEVSDCGGVRSLDRVDSAGRSLRGVLRKRLIDPSGGYLYVSLSKCGVVRKVNVHVLVLEAFAGARPSASHQGCHNDGNPANSVLANLRWDTPKGNADDRRIHGTSPSGTRKGRPNSRLTRELANWIKESRQSVASIAAAVGARHATVAGIRRNAESELDQLKGQA